MKPVHDLVVAVLGIGQHPPRPVELGGQDAEPDEHDRPARTWIRDGENAEPENDQSDHADEDAVAELPLGPFAQPLAPACPAPFGLRPPGSVVAAGAASGFAAGHGWPGLSFTNSAS